MGSGLRPPACFGCTDTPRLGGPFPVLFRYAVARAASPCVQLRCPHHKGVDSRPKGGPGVAHTRILTRRRCRLASRRKSLRQNRRLGSSVADDSEAEGNLKSCATERMTSNELQPLRYSYVAAEPARLNRRRYNRDAHDIHAAYLPLPRLIRVGGSSKAFAACRHLAGKASPLAASTTRAALRPRTSSLAERWINSSLPGLKQLDWMDSKCRCELLECHKLQGRAPPVRRFNPRDEIAVNSS